MYAVNHKTEGSLPEGFVEKDEIVMLNLDGSSATKRELIPEKVIIVDNLLTKEECQSWIFKAKQAGFFPSLIRDGQARSNRMALFISMGTALQLYEKSALKSILPTQLSNGRQLVGLHEKLRVFCYKKGDFFCPHLDGGNKYNAKNKFATSVFTLLIYLNDDFEGGSTRLWDMPEWNGAPRDIQPKVGRALIFRQRDVVHEGCQVTKAEKFVLQVSVMYAPEKGKEGIGAPFFQLVRRDNLNRDNLKLQESDRREYDL